MVVQRKPFASWGKRGWYVRVPQLTPFKLHHLPS